MCNLAEVFINNEPYSNNDVIEVSETFAMTF